MLKLFSQAETYRWGKRATREAALTQRDVATIVRPSRDVLEAFVGDIEMMEPNGCFSIIGVRSSCWWWISKSEHCFFFLGRRGCVIVM